MNILAVTEWTGDEVDADGLSACFFNLSDKLQ